MKIIWFFCCIAFATIATVHQLSLQAQETDAPPPPAPIEAAPPAPTPAPATTDKAAAEKPAAPAAPDVQAEQLKWPDTIEISETQKVLSQTSNKATLALFNTSKKSIKDADEIFNKIAKSYDDCSKKLDDINAKIDNFLQEAAFKEGKSKEQITPSIKK